MPIAPWSTERRLHTTGSPFLWVGAGLTILVAALSRGLFRVQVEGKSMLPTLAPGDRLLAVRWGDPQVGQIVVVTDPRDATRTLVKRLTGFTSKGELVVRGDNPGESTDSDSFGPISRSGLRGRVVYRYRSNDAGTSVGRKPKLASQ